VSDASPEARRFRKLLVDVNGIVIAREIGKRINICLLDFLRYFSAITQLHLH
jgi:hypothetical protein